MKAKQKEENMFGKRKQRKFVCLCMCVFFSDNVVQEKMKIWILMVWMTVEAQTETKHTNPDKKPDRMKHFLRWEMPRNKQSNFAIWPRVKVCNGNWTNTHAATRGIAATASKVFRLLLMNVKYAFVLFWAIKFRTGEWARDANELTGKIAAIKWIVYYFARVMATSAPPTSTAVDREQHMKENAGHK